MVGLPLELCPTCCTTGQARLRFVILRSPFARLASYFTSDWTLMKGHLWPQAKFAAWVEEILSEAPNASVISERDLLHVAPAFKGPVASNEVVFRLEEPESSLARVEGVLCAEPFKHCTPLPHYPTGSHGSDTRALEVEWSTRSIEL